MRPSNNYQILLKDYDWQTQKNPEDQKSSCFIHDPHNQKETKKEYKRQEK